MFIVYVFCCVLLFMFIVHLVLTQSLGCAAPCNSIISHLALQNCFPLSASAFAKHLPYVSSLDKQINKFLEIRVV